MYNTTTKYRPVVYCTVLIPANLGDLIQGIFYNIFAVQHLSKVFGWWTDQVACKELALIEDDEHWKHTLTDAVLSDSAPKLRELFITILLIVRSHCFIYGLHKKNLLRRHIVLSEYFHTLTEYLCEKAVSYCERQ